MRNKQPPRHSVLLCAKCGSTEGVMLRLDRGYICEDCADQTRKGRDTTTQAVRSMQTAIRGQADAARAELRGEVVTEQQAFKTAASEVLALDTMLVSQLPALGAGGEVLPREPGEWRDTLAAPNAAALDASAHRLDLISQLGNDVAALAIDTAETVGASNAVEKMASHQVAALHHAVMRMFSKWDVEPDPVIAMRTLSVAMRGIDTFSQAMVNLKRSCGGDTQVVRVEHVNVAAGGQAIVGNVTAGRRRK